MKKNPLGIAVLFTCIICFSVLSCSHNSDCANWNDEWATQAQKDTVSTDINLLAFIENSGSMDGYVKNMSTFKTDIYNMISSPAVKTMKLYYVNDSASPQDNDARSFILNLSPTSFKEKGGSRNATDIAKVIETVLGEQKGNNIVTLASDYIFSLGKSNTSIQNFLDLQRTDITNMFEKKAKACKDFCVVFLQNFSDFEGIYYDTQDTPYPIHQERPFYVMIAGNRNAVAKMMEATRTVAKFKNEYAEFNPMDINYAVLKENGKGNGKFRLEKKKTCNKHHISKCNADKRNGTFKFDVAVNYSTLPLGFKFLENKKNYELNDKSYTIDSIKKYTGKEPYTHIITIKANERVINSELEIKVKKSFPSWIEKGNDTKGIGAPDTTTTFGILPMLEGVKDAFARTQKSDYYTHMKIIIEK